MSTNPYESPLQPKPGNFPTATIRPAAGTVFGILNIVFGIFGICGVVVSGVMLFAAFNPNPNVPNPVIEIMNQNTFYRVFNQVGIGLGLVATIVLIVSGIGLLQLKPSGRALAIGYGIYVIVASILGAIVSGVCLFAPLLDKINTLPPGPEKAGAISGMIGGTVGPCVGLVYPVLLLIFMYRRNVIEAYRS